MRHIKFYLNACRLLFLLIQGQGGSRGRTGTAETKESGMLAATEVCEEEGFKITEIDEAIEKLQVKTNRLHLLDMTQNPHDMMLHEKTYQYMA